MLRAQQPYQKKYKMYYGIDIYWQKYQRVSSWIIFEKSREFHLYLYLDFELNVFTQLGDNPCKHGLLQLSWQNYHNDIDNLFKALLK